MAESDVSDYIEVKRFKNNRADGTTYVAQGTVAQAKTTLGEDVGQQGSFRQGPLPLHPDKQLELGVVYSFYYDKTGTLSKFPQQSWHTRPGHQHGTCRYRQSAFPQYRSAASLSSLSFCRHIVRSGCTIIFLAHSLPLFVHRLLLIRVNDPGHRI